LIRSKAQNPIIVVSFDNSPPNIFVNKNLRCNFLAYKRSKLMKTNVLLQ